MFIQHCSMCVAVSNSGWALRKHREVIPHLPNPVGFPGGTVRAEDLRDTGLIPGSERSPGERNGNPLQYSCLENPTDRGAWWDAIHGLQRVRYDWRELAPTSWPNYSPVKIIVNLFTNVHRYGLVNGSCTGTRLREGLRRLRQPTENKASILGVV